MKNKRGQLTIFIIIAIILVAGIAGFFLLRETLTAQQIPVAIEPVYNTFLSCIEDEALTGIDVLESQGGYIELPEFEAGSAYMPFSSQLNFMGNPIPYWYYISGNNIQREQVPSRQKMEESLGIFIEERIRQCDFDTYYQEGFEIIQEEPEATVSIKKEEVDIKLNMKLIINRGEDNAQIGNHEVIVKTHLGALYDSARTVYNKEQEELFLENYGIDTLRLYAPVDGVKLTCSPETWNADTVFNNLQEGIETNTFALTTIPPTTKEGKYFFVDAGINEEVRFINSRNWSNSFEVSPSEEVLMIANPVGNQPELGVLGFCYVPYHFVYDIKYPVLVQVYSGEEAFQFPVAVVIRGNKARESMGSAAKIITSDLCPYKNTETIVNTYDRNLNPVDASISYECFGETCEIGKTSSGTLTEKFPQCVNGYVVARADGFEKTRYQYSTSQEGTAEILMNKLYDMDIKLNLNNADYNGKAILSFVSDETSKVISYPEQKKINLSEGQYEISVSIYKDSSIQLQETTQQECIDVPTSGIGGIFGLSEKKCFDIKIPAQVLSNVLAGGGKQDYYILEDELKDSESIEISAEGFNVPKTIGELQNNYIAFEDKGLEVNFA